MLQHPVVPEEECFIHRYREPTEGMVMLQPLARRAHIQLTLDSPQLLTAHLQQADPVMFDIVEKVCSVYCFQIGSSKGLQRLLDCAMVLRRKCADLACGVRM